MTEFETKERYGIADLVEIVRLLRAPGGCPWDQEQDHRSIRKNLIEETYEVAEAIDDADSLLLREELGDLLLQVMLHAQMEAEDGRFTFHDVCDGICKKLIVRHPHVFGDVQVTSTGDVLRNWDAIKQQTKGQKKVSDTLESVPKTLPALMRAEKVQHRAGKAGMGYKSVDGALGDLCSEMRELSQALHAESVRRQTEELGDVLFAAVNVARFLEADPEEALNASTARFIARFTAAERLSEADGVPMKELDSAALDALWARAKKQVDKAD